MHAKAKPEAVAYTFLHAAAPPETLTYAELYARVESQAAAIHRRCPPGERAVLLYQPGLDVLAALLGCMAAGVIAVPAPVPRPKREDRRLSGILTDCAPAVVLTTSAVESLVQEQIASLSSRPLVLSTDTIGARTVEGMPDVPIAADTIALLQYTSGSTSAPKGVVLTHGNIAANQEQIQASFGCTEQSSAVSWLPLYHDMGLFGGMLLPLWAGFHVVLLAPTTFLREPIRWLRAVADYRATATGGPNFAFDHCVARITEADKQGLDLSSLELVWNGAEPIRAETLDRFSAAFGACGFRPQTMFPCYGLAESTLFVSGGPPGQADRLHLDASKLEQDFAVPRPTAAALTRSVVSCGRPAEGAEVVVVDRESRRAASPGRIGEIWVRSPAVGAGYWNDEEESARTFANFRADSSDGPYLATGDLGFVHDGQLYVTGRCKDMMIIRGRNFYPQDIEAVVAEHIPFARANACAAFAIEHEGAQWPVAVVESDRHTVRTCKRSAVASSDEYVISLERMAASGSQAVAAQLQVPLYDLLFVRPGSFPRTTSGKVQRSICRQLYLSNTLDPILSLRRGLDRVVRQAAGVAEPTAPDSLEDRIHRLVVAELNRGPGPAREAVARDVPLVSLGLDSLGITNLLWELEQFTRVPLGVESIDQDATIESIASRILSSTAERLEPRCLPLEDRPAAPSPASCHARFEAIDRGISLGKSLGLNHVLAEDAQLDGRTLTMQGRAIVNCASCSYLGLDVDPRLTAAAAEHVRRFGASFSSSRAYVSAPPYQELESLFAEIFDAYPVIAQTTTLAHLSALPVLLEEDDVAIVDVHTHNSVKMALATCGHQRQIITAPHNDFDFVRSRARQVAERGGRTWFFADGIYSMSGNPIPREQLFALLDEVPNLFAYVDDAHGMSTFGRRGEGYVLAAGRCHPKLVVAVSLNKAFGAGAGGVVVCANRLWQQKIRNCGPTMIFSGPVPPASLGAAIASARIHLSSELAVLQRELRELCCYFAENCRSQAVPLRGADEVPIKFIPIGHPSTTLYLATELLARGFFVNVCGFPAVSNNECGIRVTLTRHLRRADVDRLVTSLAGLLADVAGQPLAAMTPQAA